MHPPNFLLLLSLLHLSTSSVIRRQDPGLQSYSDVALAPGSFSNGQGPLIGLPPQVGDPLPAIYGPRSIDLPFNRLYHGNMKFFPTGQLNTPDKNTDVWGSANDNAEQSACGIPDNAFLTSKVAIHPYFLKYGGLDRYCMQDVCISFWKPDGSSDMMLKVTDICSTDPSDPTHCAKPSDIKIDRNKAQIMHHLNTQPQGDQYPDEAWWFFTKCWADGIAQPAYQGPKNWFVNPPLPNNQPAAQRAATQQWKNNQAAYPAKGWPTYPDGSYTLERTTRISPPISDWVPGQEPAWSPIAGGKGFGSGRSAGNSSSTPSSGYGSPSNPDSISNPPPPSPSPSSTSGAASTSSTSSSVSSSGSAPAYAQKEGNNTAPTPGKQGSASAPALKKGSNPASNPSKPGSAPAPAPKKGSGPAASPSKQGSTPAYGERKGSDTASDSGEQASGDSAEPGDDGQCEA